MAVVGTDRVTGTWEGTYTCAQGPTDAVLTLDDYGDGTVGAAWEFEGDDGSPGMFHLEGTYEAGQLSLTPVDWADGYELDGYEMLSLEADLSDRADTEQLEADIPVEGCTDVSVERTTTDPWYAGMWEGEYHCNELEGKGGLRLTIDSTGQDEANVVVNYFMLPDSTTNIPDVRHEATASYSDRSLTMTPGEWLDEPQGFVAVDIISYEEAPTHPYKLVGVLDYPGCSLFSLDLMDDGDGDSTTESTDD